MNDKLPPFHTEFLATAPKVKYAIGWRDEDLDRKYNISLVGITHWMPLPPLPKQPLSKEEMELERLVDTIRIQTTIEAINTLKKWKEKILDVNKRKSIVEEVNSFHQTMQHGFLKASIRAVLNEYRCLKSKGGASDEFINEELITRLLMLHKIKKNE